MAGRQPEDWAARVRTRRPGATMSRLQAASGAPHIQALLTWGYPLGRRRRAAPCLPSRGTFSIVVRCRHSRDAKEGKLQIEDRSRSRWTAPRAGDLKYESIGLMELPALG
jgi:hypothetical protein